MAFIMIFQLITDSIKSNFQNKGLHLIDINFLIYYKCF